VQSPGGAEGPQEVRILSPAQGEWTSHGVGMRARPSGLAGRHRHSRANPSANVVGERGRKEPVTEREARPTRLRHLFLRRRAGMSSVGLIAAGALARFNDRAGRTQRLGRRRLRRRSTSRLERDQAVQEVRQTAQKVASAGQRAA